MPNEPTYTNADHFLAASDFSKLEERVLVSMMKPSSRSTMFDLFYGGKRFTPKSHSMTITGHAASKVIIDDPDQQVFLGVDYSRKGDASVIAASRRDDSGKLTIEKIWEISREIDPPSVRDITLPPGYVERFAKKVSENYERQTFEALYGIPAGGQSLYGIPVKTNPMFPYEVTCSSCEGSGSGGDEATYCPKCTGTGGTRYVGMMNSGSPRSWYEPGQVVFLTEALPRKFEPSFPKGLMPVPTWR